MMGSMSGKVVVISGASGGIGEELGLLYAKRGANLVLAARNVDKLKTVQSQCQNNGASSAEIMRCDVSDENDCKALVALAVEKFGSIDVLILNAGLGQAFFLEAMSPDVDIRQFMDINYYGCVNITIAALPIMQQSNGVICVVSSLGGLLPFPRQTLYNASKYALIGFYDTLRMELKAKGSGIDICMICPGFVKTGITAGGGIGKDGTPVGVSLDKASPIPMITAKHCADEIGQAVASRKKLLIVPSWYKPTYYLHKLFPGLVEALLIKLFAPPPKHKSTAKK